MESIDYLIFDTKNMWDHGSPTMETLGDSLLIDDNFDKKTDQTNDDTKYYINRPLKLSLTISLTFCIEGEIVCRRNTEEHRLKKNDVYFNKGGSFGELISFSKDMKMMSIIINEKFYYPIFSSLDLSILQKEFIYHPICTLSDYHIKECISIYQLLKERLSAHKEELLQEEIIRGYLQALIFIVCSQYESFSIRVQDKRHKKKLPRQQDLFIRFMEQLRENYMQDRNIAFYADKLCVTPHYLSRIIHSASGYSANEHINLFVITEAKQLLKSKKYTILQVSEMLNFTSPSIFSRYFKKQTGYLPKEYQSL